MHCAGYNLNCLQTLQYSLSGSLTLTGLEIENHHHETRTHQASNGIFLFN